MKKLLSLIGLLALLTPWNCPAPVYPSSDFIGQRFQTNKTAAGARETLGAPSFTESTNIVNVAISNALVVTNFNNGQFMNFASYDTNLLYLTGAGSADVNQTYYTNAVLGWYTNAINDLIVRKMGSFYYVTNDTGKYYRANVLGLGAWAIAGGIGDEPAPSDALGINYTYRTNMDSFITTAFAVNEGKGRFVSVSAIGNDATAKRGSWQYPYLTITCAGSNMMSGDTMFVGSGSFIADTVLLPPGASIRGQGRDQTFITVAQTNTSALGVRIGPMGMAADATFITANFLDYSFPLYIYGSTNITSKLRIIGSWDGLFYTGCELAFDFDSEVYSHYDAFYNPGASTNAHFWLFNTKLHAQAGQLTNGWKQYANAVVSGNGTIHLINCDLTAKNGTNVTAGLHTVINANTVFDLQGVRFNVSTTNESATVTNDIYLETGGTVFGNYYSSRGNYISSNDVYAPNFIGKGILNLAASTNLPPQGLNATNTGDVGWSYRWLSPTNGYWAP